MIDEAETRILSDDEEASLRPSREGRLFDPFAIYEDDAGDGQDEPFVPPASSPARSTGPSSLPGQLFRRRLLTNLSEAPVDVAPEPEPAAQVSVEAVEENAEDRMTAKMGRCTRIMIRCWLRTLRARVWPRRWPRPISTDWGWSSWSSVWRWRLPATARTATVRSGSGRRAPFGPRHSVGAPVGPSDVVTMPRLSRAFDAEPPRGSPIASNDGPGNDGGVDDAGRGGVFTLARGEPACSRIAIPRSRCRARAAPWRRQSG
jgi:hypothetical protein